jgi:hypothetical protein
VVEGRYEGLNLTPPEEGFELYRRKNAAPWGDTTDHRVVPPRRRSAKGYRVRSYVRRIVMEEQSQRYFTVEEHRRYERARRQFAQLELLGLHVAVYLVYNVTLFLVFGEPSPYRYLWWGLGLIFHALATFAFGTRLAAGVEKRIWRRAESETLP